MGHKVEGKSLPPATSEFTGDLKHIKKRHNPRKFKGFAAMTHEHGAKWREFWSNVEGKFDRIHWSSGAREEVCK
ncbi:hypothetical protein CQ018_00870 [Arthrobacter sp. MYb227]|nr:hypothetical protein CQ018_00870 [Arthrobacter sp. MYb227]